MYFKVVCILTVDSAYIVVYNTSVYITNRVNTLNEEDKVGK